MKPAVFLLQLTRTWGKSVAGFTVTELLVTLLLTNLMMMTMTRFFTGGVTARHDGKLRAEAQQGLRALIGNITQELRQAGACMGNLTGAPLQGTNNSARDGLTVRIGRVNTTTLQCLQSALNVTATAGDTTITIRPDPGFSVGDLVYVSTAGGANGATYSITGKGSPDADGQVVLTLNRALDTFTTLYTPGAAVVAINERVYAIDTSTYGTSEQPVLTVSIDGGTAQPLVDGVQVFDVVYFIGPCAPTCAATVSLPSSSAQWRLVTEIGIKATVRAHKTDRTGQNVEETTGSSGSGGEYINIKPRNFLI